MRFTPEPRNCVHCGQPFIAGTNKAAYCTRSCVDAAWWLRKNPPAAMRCSDCGEPVVRCPGSRGRLPRQCIACSTPTAAVCVDCGTTVDRIRPGAPGSPARRCRECMRAYRVDQTQARRAVTAGVEVEAVASLKVFERDRWTCGICHEPVDPTIRHPDRQSASLDHIVPLGLGGSHTWSNVRCAHMGCNSSVGQVVRWGVASNG